MNLDIAKNTVDRKKIIQAIKAVRVLHSQWLENAKTKSLLVEEEDTSLYLQVTLHKIPYIRGGNVQMLKIPLPHSLVSDTTEVCLFTGDLDKRDKKAEIEPTVLHYKELLSKHDVQKISEIIPLRQLRTEYKPYEAKRQLVAGYDVFLADEKIAQCLPKVLGTSFWKKHKFPQVINLQKKNLKHQVDKALSTSVLFITGKGNSCCVEVARLGFKRKQIADNIEAVARTLESKLPGSWDNVLGLYLKTAKSIAVPIYISLDSGNDVKLPQRAKREKVEPEDLSTLPKRKVMVFKTGAVKVVPNPDDVCSSDCDSDSETELLMPESRNVNRKSSKIV